MKGYAKILGVVLVGLAIQLALAAGEKGVGDSLVSRAFTVVSNINSLVSRAFTVSTNTDSLVSRAFTVSSNTDSLVSRAFTVTSNTDSLVSRAFTAVNCDPDGGDGGLCSDCDGDGIPDQCELDCGDDDGPCDIEGCGQSDDCNGNGVPDECEISDCTGEPECSDCNENGIPDECEPDCDEDGIPDECVIADCAGEPDCSDCNGNGIPDGCEPDCNDNTVPDDCDIDPEDPDENGEVSNDCNGNGVPDECDLDPDDPDGNGDVSGDCDDDGVLDECEIADCDGDAECGDCNVNGIPDGCDIDSGFSQDDVPPPKGDGVPDECVVWNGESNDLWSADGNWEGNDAPGDGDPNVLESVVIAVAGANVILDVKADNPNIDSLLLDRDTTLHVTGSNLSVLDPLGIFDGNMLVRGDLKIGDGRAITAAGEVTIGPGGIYHAEDPNDLLLNATLAGGSITVQGGSLDEVGGIVALTGSMELNTNGDLNLQSEQDDGDKGGCKGSDTPPDFNSADNSQVRVMGNFAVGQCAEVSFTSTAPAILDGNLQNQSTMPAGFNWDTGGLQMNGSSQTIEAAGEDRGPWPSGLEDNFVIGTLTLVANADVQVVDEFDNQRDGLIACDEALYVDTLIVGQGAMLLTDGCRVYYNALTNDGDVPGLGIDVLQILTPIPADLNGDGRVGPFDLALVLGFWGPCSGSCAPEGEPATCPESCTPEDHAAICPSDISGDCEVGPLDLALVLGNWGPVE